MSAAASDNRLFIYGTLLPGCAPASMAGICKRLTPIAPARIQGTLYSLGPYPAITLGGDSFVAGELIEIDSDETWRELDRYEGCPRQGGGDGLFQRVRTSATLVGSGESVECWSYVYNRDLSRAKVIKSGCWRTHRGLK